MIAKNVTLSTFDSDKYTFIEEFSEFTVKALRFERDKATAYEWMIAAVDAFIQASKIIQYKDASSDKTGNSLTEGQGIYEAVDSVQRLHSALYQHSVSNVTDDFLVEQAKSVCRTMLHLLMKQPSQIVNNVLKDRISKYDAVLTELTRGYTL
jgi:hypothetical protein